MQKTAAADNQLVLGTFLAAILLFVAIGIGYKVAKPSNAAHSPHTHAFNVTAGKKDVGQLLPVLSVQKGDLVVINISSAQAGMIMVHGFDDMPQVDALHPAVFQMRATQTGRFSLHLHTSNGTQIDIATIEVSPDD
ncbi:hypothetical protein ABH944_008332 [Caballeronia udeis]|uniref:Uncharacterized protein n=1 Tax=Caballeronia udeis TaxID=1232866 RepID=A0ABW8MY70_9BURK